MDNAKDNFSKDVRNMYLADVDERVVAYCAALEEAMCSALSNNGAISASQNAANALAKVIDYTNDANKGKATERLGLLDGYKMAIEANAERVAAAAAEGIFYNETKTINDSPDYTLEAFIKNVYKEASHPNAVRYLLYKLVAEAQAKVESLNEAKGRLRKAMDKYSANADDTGAFNAEFTKDAEEATLADLCAAERHRAKTPPSLKSTSVTTSVSTNSSTSTSPHTTRTSRTTARPSQSWKLTMLLTTM